ncbi:Cystathionine beta-lyase [compost metagenome]
MASPDRLREHSFWSSTQPVVRLHVGLEDPQDLIADLAQAFERVAQGVELAAA